jgi:hypothetical protein
MDVYGFNLTAEQYTQGFVLLQDLGDGAVTSFNIFQIGWEVTVMLKCPNLCREFLLR